MPMQLSALLCLKDASVHLLMRFRFLDQRVSTYCCTITTTKMTTSRQMAWSSGGRLSGEGWRGRRAEAAALSWGRHVCGHSSSSSSYCQQLQLHNQAPTFAIEAVGWRPSVPQHKRPRSRLVGLWFLFVLFRLVCVLLPESQGKKDEIQ